MARLNSTNLNGGNYYLMSTFGRAVQNDRNTLVANRGKPGPRAILAIKKAKYNLNSTNVIILGRLNGNCKRALISDNSASISIS